MRRSPPSRRPGGALRPKPAWCGSRAGPSRWAANRASPTSVRPIPSPSSRSGSTGAASPCPNSPAYLETLRLHLEARGPAPVRWDDRDARIHKLDGRWRADAGFADHPANEMRWYGAARLLRVAGQAAADRAEREFAARGRRAGTYPWAKRRRIRRAPAMASGWTQPVPPDHWPAARRPTACSTSPATCRMDLEHRARLSLPADDGREDPDKLADRPARRRRRHRTDTLRGSWRGKSVSRGARRRSPQHRLPLRQDAE